MSLRGPGLAALSRHTTSTAAYNHLSSQLTAQQLTDLRSQLDTFSAALRQFASAHRNDILRDPQFRGEFQRMCANIGVDPLGAAKVSGSGSRIEGLWNDLLGLGDFNYELGVQVVDVCISTRALNGGVIEMDALIRRLQQMRGGGGGSSDDASASTAISEEDVVRAIKSLEPLGSGYQVVSTSTAPGAPKLVHSLPGELSLDSTLLLSRLALPTCPRVGPFAYLTEEDVARAHKWTRQRARNALQRMCNDEGTLWVDVDGGDRYNHTSTSVFAKLTARLAVSPNVRSRATVVQHATCYLPASRLQSRTYHTARHTPVDDDDNLADTGDGAVGGANGAVGDADGAVGDADGDDAAGDADSAVSEAVWRHPPASRSKPRRTYNTKRVDYQQSDIGDGHGAVGGNGGGDGTVGDVNGAVSEAVRRVYESDASLSATAIEGDCHDSLTAQSATASEGDGQGSLTEQSATPEADSQDSSTEQPATPEADSHGSSTEQSATIEGDSHGSSTEQSATAMQGDGHDSLTEQPATIEGDFCGSSTERPATMEGDSHGSLTEQSATMGNSQDSATEQFATIEENRPDSSPEQSAMTGQGTSDSSTEQSAMMEGDSGDSVSDFASDSTSNSLPSSSYTAPTSSNEAIWPWKVAKTPARMDQNARLFELPDPAPDLPEGAPPIPPLWDPQRHATRFVLFDVLGTLLDLREHPGRTYARFTATPDSQELIDACKREFPAVFKYMQRTYPCYSGIGDSPQAWWQQLISIVLRRANAQPPPDKLWSGMVNEVSQHFASSQAYRRKKGMTGALLQILEQSVGFRREAADPPGVAFPPLWEAYQRPWGALEMPIVSMGFASNSDERILQAVTPLLDLSKRVLARHVRDPRCNFANVLGAEKPHDAFWQRLLQRLRVDPQDAHSVVIVGDDLEKDVIAPAKHGFKAIWCDFEADRSKDVNRRRELHRLWHENAPHLRIQRAVSPHHIPLAIREWRRQDEVAYKRTRRERNKWFDDFKQWVQETEGLSNAEFHEKYSKAAADRRKQAEKEMLKLLRKKNRWHRRERLAKKRAQAVDEDIGMTGRRQSERWVAEQTDQPAEADKEVGVNDRRRSERWHTTGEVDDEVEVVARRQSERWDTAEEVDDEVDMVNRRQSERWGTGGELDEDVQSVTRQAGDRWV